MKHAPQEIRTYFLTFVTAERRRLFQVHDTAQLMFDTLQTYRSQGKYEMYAFIIMPDHIHLLLTPAPDTPLEKAVQLIKGGFSFRLKTKLDVWARGYFDRRIVDRAAFEACVRYIEENPVRAHLPESAVAYDYRSAMRPQAVDPAPVWFNGTHQG